MNDMGLRRLAAAGLITGSAFGLAGSFLKSDVWRGLAWGLDGSALVMASAILVLLCHRRHQELAAAGFLCFLAGQTLVVSGAAMSLADSTASFGSGAALWSVGLVLISSSNCWPALVRGLGFAAAALFGLTALQIFVGTALTPLSRPLPFFAYPLFVATMIGWAHTLLKASGLPAGPGDQPT